MAKVRTRQRGGSWYYSYELPSVGGKRKRKEVGGFASEQEAYDAGIKDMAKYNDGEPTVKKQGLSLSDYLDYWYENHVKINMRYNTCYNYEKVIRLHIKPTLGRYKLQNLTPLIIQEWLNKKPMDGYMRSSLDDMKKVLSGALKYAVYPAQLLTHNPAAGVVLPNVDIKPQSPDEKVLSEEDMQKLIKRFPPGNPYYIMIMIGYYTGLRIGEVLGLTWDCVDLENQTISVEKTMTRLYGQTGQIGFGAPKTKESERVVSFGSTLASALRKHKIMQAENELKYGGYYRRTYLLEEKQGNKIFQHVVSAEKSVPMLAKKIDMVCTQANGEFVKPSSFSHVTKIARVELGINFSFHSFRHTHATVLIENGANIKEVQRRLGHSSFETTMDTYSHATQKMSSDAVDIFESAARGIS